VFHQLKEIGFWRHGVIKDRAEKSA